jgi:hypothetical protein
LVLFTFEITVLLHAQANLDFNPPVHASQIAGMTGACHHAQLLLVEMESLNFFFPELDLNLDFPNIHLPFS